MYSRTSEYALCILGYLARKPESQVLASQASTDLDLPSTYVAKIMGRLRLGGFVSSQKGRGGGFKLAREPKDIRLLEVVSFLDGPAAEKTCLLGQKICSTDTACVLHEYWDKVKQLRQDMLQRHTVADLASSTPLKCGWEV